MNINILDMVFITIAVIIVIKVTFRGFIAEFFSMAAFLLATGAAFIFHRPLAVKIASFSLSLTAARFAAFFAIFIAVFIAVKCVQAGAAAIFRFEILRSLDHALGFFLGLFEAYIILILLIIILNLQPFVDQALIYSGSMLIKLFEPLPIVDTALLHIIKG